MNPRSLLLHGIPVLIVLYLWLMATAGFASAQSLDAESERSAASGEAPPGSESENRLPDPAELRTEGEAPALLNAAGLSRGVDAIIAAIRDREVELIRREQKIAERERSVVELETIIEERTLELDRVRQNVEDRIANWAKQGPDRVQQLANVYSAMPPVRAADLLGKLDLDLAVSVIQGMKKKKSASVLSAMRADRALSISQRILQPLSPKTDAPAARRK